MACCSNRVFENEDNQRLSLLFHTRFSEQQITELRARYNQFTFSKGFPNKKRAHRNRPDRLHAPELRTVPQGL